MTDGHIHIERGPYTLNWIDRFVSRAVEMGLDEIRLLEHNYILYSRNSPQCTILCGRTANM